jgi:hypothetical protein
MTDKGGDERTVEGGEEETGSGGTTGEECTGELTGRGVM